jgi:hypothetical protein
MRVKHGEGFYQPVLGFIGAAKMKFRKMHGMILLDRLHQHARHAVLRCVL